MTRSYFALGVAALAAFTVGCTRPRGVDSPRTDGPVELRPLAAELYSGIPDSGRVVIRDATAWSSMWQRAYAHRGSVPPTPAVDFQREVVIFAALGERGTGGYTIQIDSARAAGDAVDVFVSRTSPGPKCGATMAVTAPFAAAAMTATRKTIRFVERAVVTACGGP